MGDFVRILTFLESESLNTQKGKLGVQRCDIIITIMMSFESVSTSEDVIGDLKPVPSAVWCIPVNNGALVRFTDYELVCSICGI